MALCYPEDKNTRRALTEQTCRPSNLASCLNQLFWRASGRTQMLWPCPDFDSWHWCSAGYSPLNLLLGGSFVLFTICVADHVNSEMGKNMGWTQARFFINNTELSCLQWLSAKIVLLGDISRVCSRKGEPLEIATWTWIQPLDFMEVNQLSNTACQAQVQ